MSNRTPPSSHAPSNEVLAAMIAHEREMRKQQEANVRQALKLQAKENLRRLEGLNHAHDQTRADQATYVNGQVYVGKIAEIENRLNKKDLEAQEANAELRAASQKAKDLADEAIKKAGEVREEVNKKADEVRAEADRKASLVREETTRKDDAADKKNNRRITIAGLIMGAVIALAKFVPIGVTARNDSLPQYAPQPAPAVSIPFKDANVTNVKEKP